LNGHPFALEAQTSLTIDERRGNMSRKAKTVRLRPNPAIADMLKRWTLRDEPNIGWCLACDRPIRDLNDLIPETDFHRCRGAASEDGGAGPSPNRIH
jgi:hypothetical protein